MTLTHELEHARRAREAIEELIAEPSLLGPDLQPVRRFADGAVVGHKATGRGKPGTEVADTLGLLAGAQSLGLVERLDWAFRCHTFDVVIAQGLTGELHLTPEPETFLTLCPPRLAASWGRGRRQVSVVAELHDDAFDDVDRLGEAVAEMRTWGWRFSVADLSQLPVAVESLDWVRPTYVQIDVADRVGGPARDAWLAAGRRAGADVLAVNVDDLAARTVAVVAGAVVGRGELLGSASGALTRV